MAVKNTDFLLVHRGGTDYKTPVEKFLEIIPTPDLEGVLTFKGTVDSEAALPNRGAVTGDFYIASDTSTYYAWNGSEWQDVGRVEVDLEPYVKQEDLDLALEGKQDKGDYLVEADLDGYATSKQLGDAVAKEAAEREASDKDLQQQIDGLEAYDDSALQQAVGDVASGLAQEVKDRADGDKDLQDQIDGLEGYDDSEIKQELGELQEGFDKAIIAAGEGKDNLIIELATYAKKDHTHSEYLTASDLPEEYDDAELRALIDGKADVGHTHDDLATKEELAQGLGELVKVDEDLQDQIDNLNFVRPIPDGVTLWKEELTFKPFQNVAAPGTFGITYDRDKGRSTVSLPAEFGVDSSPWNTGYFFVDDRFYSVVSAVPTAGNNLWIIVDGDATRGCIAGANYDVANWYQPVYVSHEELNVILGDAFNVGKLDDLPA